MLDLQIQSDVMISRKLLTLFLAHFVACSPVDWHHPDVAAAPDSPSTNWTFLVDKSASWETNRTLLGRRRLGASLKKLRNKLKDESFDFPLERRPEEVAKLFADREHDRVRNIVFVHQDLVGASVPVQILKVQHHVLSETFEDM